MSLYQAKSELSRALGHPVRIRVLELLDDGPKTVRELLAAIAIEASRTARQSLTHVALGQGRLLAELRLEHAS